jgi:hypothetical protein
LEILLDIIILEDTQTLSSEILPDTQILKDAQMSSSGITLGAKTLEVEEIYLWEVLLGPTIPQE